MTDINENISNESSTSTININSSHNSIRRKRRVPVRDYLNSTDEGSLFCKLCQIKFGKDTATSTML